MSLIFLEDLALVKLETQRNILQSANHFSLKST